MRYATGSGGYNSTTGQYLERGLGSSRVCCGPTVDPTLVSACISLKQFIATLLALCLRASSEVPSLSGQSQPVSAPHRNDVLWLPIQFGFLRACDGWIAYTYRSRAHPSAARSRQMAQGICRRHRETASILIQIQNHHSPHVYFKCAWSNRVSGGATAAMNDSMHGRLLWIRTGRFFASVTKAGKCKCFAPQACDA